MNFYILENEELKAVLSNDEIGDQTPIITANVSEKLTSYDILTLEIPADNDDIKYLKENNTIVYEDIKGYREYIINEVEDVDSDSITRTVISELSSIELIDEIVQTELNGSSNSPSTILTSALNGTRWTVGSVDSAIYNSTFKEATKYKSVLEVLDLISSQFNCEVQFSYVVDRGQVVKRQVNLYKQFGENNGKRFEMDKDVSSIKRTIDSGNVKTAIIPLGKIKDAKDDTLVDIKDLVWSKANGDPVDKPKGQNYIGHPDALAQWGRLNANGTKRHRFITVEMEVDSVAQLAIMAWIQLGNYINPKITYESSVVDLYTLNNQSEDFKHEHVNLGDTVVVIDNYFTVPIVVQSRIVEMERNLLDPTDKKVVFGDSLEQFSIGSVSDSVDNIKNKLDEVEKNTNAVTESANGKNTNNYGSDIPANNITGDLWYRPHPTNPNESQMLIWDGTQWILELDTSDLSIVKKEVEAVIEQADVDRSNVETGIAKSLTDAKTYADTKAIEWNTKLDVEMAEAETGITKAYTDAVKDGKAYTDTKATEFNAELAIVEADTLKAKTDANNAVESANTANTKAEQAIEDAGFAKVDSGTAILTANQAKASATTATEKALKAITDSGTAVTNAGTALINANKAIADNKISDGKVLAITSEVDTVKGQLSTKVESSVVNALTSTVSSLDTKVSQNASELTSKATKTEVNTISGKVDSNVTKISQNATAITAKADKSVVDTLTQTVNTTKAQVDILPNKIELGVQDAKTYVDELTNGSSVANKTEILSGNPVFTDKSDDAVVHVGVDGKSEQNAGSGKNILAYMELGGVAWATGLDASLTDRIRSNYIPVSLGDVVSYSENGIGIPVAFYEYDINKQPLDPRSNGVITYTLKNSGVAFVRIIRQSSTNVNAKSQLEEGSVATAYEPPIPSPDYPIAIKSLDKSFDIVSSVGGRNLVLNSFASRKYTHPRDAGEGGFQYTPTKILNNGKVFTITGWFRGETSANLIVYRISPKGNSPINFITKGNLSATEWKKFSLTFSPHNNYDLTQVFVYLSYNQPLLNDWFEVKELKLEEGSTATPYSPAPEDIQPNILTNQTYKTNLTLAEPLRSVGSVKDRLFLDADGLWKVEQNVGEHVLNIDNLASQGLSWALTNTLRIQISKDFSGALVQGLAKIRNNLGISYGYHTADNQHLYLEPTGLIIFIEKKYFNSNDVAGYTEFITKNPFVLNYQLAKPVTETLSAEQQTYLNNIASFKGSNYVYTVDKSGILFPELHATFKSSGWYRNFTFGVDISGLSGRVTTNESSLTVQANQIASKVAKTDFDVLAGKQQATQSELTQTAGSLTSKITNVETDVAKRATKVEFSSLEQTVSGISTTVGNHTGQISTIQQTALGLQTTVADKADKSQITQLSGQIATKVETATYNSKMTQLDSSITSKVSATDYNTQITQLTTDINLRATKAGIMSQLNLNPEGILLQGKNIMLDGNVTMATAFVTDIKAKSLEAVYADIATLKTKVLTADVITSTHIKSDTALIDKVFATTANITQLTSKSAFITNVKATSLEAIYADIANLKTKVLTADVITSTMIKSDTAVIDKLFATDANIGRLTAKTAFINSVKAVDISADRITAGTLNASNVSIINLNANNIATGTISGVNSAWNLNTGNMLFKNPTTGDELNLSQGEIKFQSGTQGRYLRYHSEGLRLIPFESNTGINKNTGLHLIGGGDGSTQYIQFLSKEVGGVNQRVEAVGDEMVLSHGQTGILHVRRYGQDDSTGSIRTAKYITYHSNGSSLVMAADSITAVPASGGQNIFLVPLGTGSVISGNSSGVRYNMVASDFVKQSTRDSKTDIKSIETKGLDVINRLNPVSYKKKDKVNDGIIETELGFIAEDSLEVATTDGLGIYDSHITAYLVKAVQELNAEIKQLKGEI